MEMWKSCMLSDLGEIVGGGTPSTKVQENYENGTISWITPKDLAGLRRRFISQGERNITEQGLRSCSAQMMPKGTILFSSRAPIGYVAIANNELCTNQGFKSIVPNAGMDSLFLYYLLVYNKNRIENVGIGTTFKEVSAKTMRGISVRVPTSIIHQKRIADILSMLDERIEYNQAINKNLEEQAQAIFDEIISFSSTEKCFLSDIANINPKRQLPKGTVARCVDMSQLSATSCCPVGWEFKSFNGGMKFCNGDTLLARITPCLENGKKAYINFLQENEIAFGSTEYIVISPKEAYPTEFFYCLVNDSAFADYAVKNLNGSSGRQRVSAKVIGQYRLPKISTERFSYFSGIASSSFTVIRNNFYENIRLAALRDALLPRLMSGELDVSNIEL